MVPNSRPPSGKKFRKTDLQKHWRLLVQWVELVHPSSRLLPIMRDPGSIPRGVLIWKWGSPVSVVSLQNDNYFRTWDWPALSPQWGISNRSVAGPCGPLMGCCWAWFWPCCCFAANNLGPGPLAEAPSKRSALMSHSQPGLWRLRL